MPLEPEIIEALKRIPLLAKEPAEKLATQRLGGLTNRNYRIDAPSGRYVLRIPGEKTGDYINRKVEAHNARAAAAAKVNAEVLFFDEGDGLMLCRYLDGTVSMTPALFHERQGARMLDVLLSPEGERCQDFYLGLALDREHPIQTAVGMISPLAVVPTTTGPPHIGPSGWLFHVDSPNLLLINMRPTDDGGRSFIATFLETSGVHGGTAELRCVRDPSGATLVDGDDHPTTGLTVVGDGVRLDFAAGELLRVRVDL